MNVNFSIAKLKVLSFPGIRMLTKIQHNRWEV